MYRRGCYCCLRSLQGGRIALQVHSEIHTYIPISISFINLSTSSLLGRFLYPLELSLKEKIEVICKEMYGADGVEYSEQAEQRLQVERERILTASSPSKYGLIFSCMYERSTLKRDTTSCPSAWRRHSTPCPPTRPRRVYLQDSPS